MPEGGETLQPAGRRHSRLENERRRLGVQSAAAGGASPPQAAVSAFAEEEELPLLSDAYLNTRGKLELGLG